MSTHWLGLFCLCQTVEGLSCLRWKSFTLKVTHVDTQNTSRLLPASVSAGRRGPESQRHGNVSTQQAIQTLQQDSDWSEASLISPETLTRPVEQDRLHELLQ